MQWRRRGPLNPTYKKLGTLARAEHAHDTRAPLILHGQVFLHEIWHLDSLAKFSIFVFIARRIYGMEASRGVFMSRATLIIFGIPSAESRRNFLARDQADGILARGNEETICLPLQR